MPRRRAQITHEQLKRRRVASAATRFLHRMTKRLGHNGKCKVPEKKRRGRA